MQSKIDLVTLDLIHAHFLFRAGGDAYQLKRNHGILYLVAVRNKDINLFFEYMLHLRGLGRKILSSAQKVMFVTSAYSDLWAQKYLPSNMKSDISSAPVNPNGFKPE